MTLAQVLIAVAGILLVIAAFFALWRLAKGPTSLDRGIASDVIVAILIAAVAGHSMWTHTSFGLLVILVLSLVGLTGAVGLARLITRAAQNRALYDARDAANGADHGGPDAAHGPDAPTSTDTPNNTDAPNGKGGEQR